jgi:hypothetical protein
MPQIGFEVTVEGRITAKRFYPNPVVQPSLSKKQ